MNKFAVMFVLALAAPAMATNNVPSYLLKRPPYQNSPVYLPPPSAPAFHPLKYGYAAPPATLPVYAMPPPEYAAPVSYLPASYVPASYVPAPVPASYVPASYVPASYAKASYGTPVPAPAPGPSIPPQVLASLKANQFIGRHFPPYH